MQPYFLGIDIGTGSTKAVAVNRKGEAFHTVQEFYTTKSPAPGHFEQEPEAIWNAFVHCIRTIVSELHQPPEAVALSSAMHSLILVDEGGKSLTPLLTWADQRSADIAERLKTSSMAEDLYHHCGTPLHAMAPLSKIIWWRENEPLLFQQAYKFIGIKEYIWHRLFHDFQIDYSLASATGLFDVEECVWYAPALHHAGITEQNLSQLVATTLVRTDLPEAMTRQLLIKSGTPFVIGASDGCAANLGSSSLLNGTAAITVGTSGAVRIASLDPIRVFHAQLFNYRLEEEIFITGGPINNGGAAVKWYFEQFYQNAANDYNDILNDLPGLPPGAEGLIFLPYLLGERAPIWDSKSSGVFFGLTQNHSPLHLLKAVVEGVCFALNEVLQILEQHAQPINTVHISGGFTQSDASMQILANVTGKQICLMQTEDASAIGVVYLAWKALGIINHYNELPQLQVVRTLSPQAEQVKIYRDYFALYRNLYPVMKPFMHALHQLKTNS